MAAGLAIGIDTSCYTTSVAAADARGIVFDKRAMLFVPQGGRGLRQSDAVFAHTRNLPDLVGALFAAIGGAELLAVAVSARPADEENSYMPAFLAGRSAAAAIAASRRVPLIETTHQRGHIRAALIGNEALLAKDRFLALHLSGGTTDLLTVTLGRGRVASVARLGRSADLHAGQFVDRVGVRLGLPFPCGKHLEQLAAKAAETGLRIPSSVRGMNCSFSGAETQAGRLIESGADRAATAFAVYGCLARTVEKLVRNARAETGVADVLLCGGVSGSALLRTLLEARLDKPALYADPTYAPDNAAGVALLGREGCQ